MNRFAIGITVVLAAVCAGLAFHADACSERKVSTAQRRDRRISRVAIAGLVDVNQDGKSDLEVVRRVIERNGGRIDAEFRTDGTLAGKLRRGTDYIVLGEFPDKTAVSPRGARQFDSFMRRAGKLGIPVIPLKQLLANGSPSRNAERDAKSGFRPRRRPQQPY